MLLPSLIEVEIAFSSLIISVLSTVVVGAKLLYCHKLDTQIDVLLSSVLAQYRRPLKIQANDGYPKLLHHKDLRP